MSVAAVAPRGASTQPVSPLPAAVRGREAPPRYGRYATGGRGRAGAAPSPPRSPGAWSARRCRAHARVSHDRERFLRRSARRAGIPFPAMAAECRGGPRPPSAATRQSSASSLTGYANRIDRIVMVSPVSQKVLPGYPELPWHREEAPADFLAAVLDRGETIPTVQTSVTSPALSGFEAHRDAPFPSEPSNASDKLVTGHGTTDDVHMCKALADASCKDVIR